MGCWVRRARGTVLLLSYSHVMNHPRLEVVHIYSLFVHGEIEVVHMYSPFAQQDLSCVYITLYYEHSEDQSNHSRFKQHSGRNYSYSFSNLLRKMY